jgi:DNA-binding YbaB/EbfC family protein
MKNLGQMMKQVQDMQEKMQCMQEQQLAMEVEGSSGAGMVRVTLNGKGEMRAIRLDPSIVGPGDIEVLEDLIMAAVNDAHGKVEQRKAEEMQKLTGGLPLPPGFKLPF